MAAQTTSSRALLGAVLISISASLVACSGDKAANEGASAEGESAPVVSLADSLSPEGLVLHGLECRMSLNRARAIAERLPAATAQNVTAAPDLSFFGLIRKGDDLSLTMEARQKASNSSRQAPRANEPVTDEYVKYIEDCAAIAVRAASLLTADAS